MGHARRCAVMLVATGLLAGGCVNALPATPDAAVTSRINSRPPALLEDATRPPDPPLDAGEAWLVDQRCSGCHTLDRVTRTRLGWRGWRGEVGHMIQLGAKMTIAEQQRIVDYLAWRW